MSNIVRKKPVSRCWTRIPVSDTDLSSDLYAEAVSVFQPQSHKTTQPKMYKKISPVLLDFIETKKITENFNDETYRQLCNFTQKLHDHETEWCQNSTKEMEVFILKTEQFVLVMRKEQETKKKTKLTMLAMWLLLIAQTVALVGLVFYRHAGTPT